MPLKQRKVLLARSAMLAVATGLLSGFAASAAGVHRARANDLRHVRRNTVISEEAPKAEFLVSREFSFIGTRQINLYGNAEAEQYVFAKPGSDHVAESFYLIQFEHFLPSNDRTYKYDSMRPTQVGDLKLIYDVKSWTDLARAIAEEPGSDVASLGTLLRAQNLSFPHKTVLVRMIQLPTADHRTELMILYGEAIPEDSAIPVRKEGVSLDAESPDSAQRFLDHARQRLVIQAR